MATPTSDREFEHDVVVIGGCGHVGLPLAIAFAEHPEYRGMSIDKPVADIWNVLGGVLI